MLKRIVDLLKPEVSVEAKQTGITLFIGKQLEKLDARLRTRLMMVLIPHYLLEPLSILEI